MFFRHVNLQNIQSSFSLTKNKFAKLCRKNIFLAKDDWLSSNKNVHTNKRSVADIYRYFVSKTFGSSINSRLTGLSIN